MLLSPDSQIPRDKSDWLHVGRGSPGPIHCSQEQGHGIQMWQLEAHPQQLRFSVSSPGGK